MMVALVSFGYKYGIPADADLVFDVRFLPNPHFIPSCASFPGATRASPAISAPSLKPESFCGASRVC